MPSILAYAQPAEPAGRMPTAYYPGPAPAPPHKKGAHGSRRAVLALALALVVVLSILILYRVLVPRALASGLARNGWTVYLLRGCGHCDRQAALLSGFHMVVRYGPDGKLLGGYTKTPPLAFGDIKAFPCWYNLLTGEKRLGFQDVAALEKMAF